MKSSARGIEAFLFLYCLIPSVVTGQALTKTIDGAPKDFCSQSRADLARLQEKTGVEFLDYECEVSHSGFLRDTVTISFTPNFVPCSDKYVRLVDLLTANSSTHYQHKLAAILGIGGISSMPESTFRHGLTGELQLRIPRCVDETLSRE